MVRIQGRPKRETSAVTEPNEMMSDRDDKEYSDTLEDGEENVIKMTEIDFDSAYETKVAEEDKLYSDNLKDIVKVKCSHCEMVMQNHQQYGHLRNQHAGKLKNFKFINKVYHRCKICSKEFLFCTKNMREHIRIHHKDVCSDWNKYCKLYLAFDHSSEKEEIKDEIKTEVPDADPLYEAEGTSEEHKVHSENPEEYSSVKDEVKVEIKMEVEGDGHEVENEDPVEENIVYSDNLKDLVKVKCGHCGKITKKTLISYHLKSKHPGQSKIFDYPKKVYHRCKICDRKVLFCSTSIGNHIRERHADVGVNWKEYRALYLTPEQFSEIEAPDIDPEGETDEPAEEDIVYSDYLKDLVKVKCGYCGKICENPQRSKHMKIHHPRQINNFHIIKKVYHRCKICCKEFLFCRKNLRGHLREHHTHDCWDWKVYSELYLRSDDSTDTEDVKHDAKMEITTNIPEDEINRPAEEEREYSDNVKDLVRVKCGHCGMTIQNKLRVPHMNTYHPGQQRNFEFVKKVYHRCKICCKEFLFCLKNMKEHLKIHHKDVCEDWNRYCERYLNKGNQKKDEPSEEEKVFSDNLKDIVKVKCGYCGMVIQNHLRLKHMNDNHSGWVKNFTFFKKVYHRCKICGKEFLFCPKNMREHIRLRHKDIGLEWEEYCNLYLTIDDTTEEEGLQDDIKMDITDSQQDEIYEPLEEEKEYSDDLKDVVRVKCGKCGIIIQNQSRLHHLREIHPGQSGHFQSIKKVYHRCKICSRELLFCPKNIRRHLILCHKDACGEWKEYCARYLSLAGEGARAATVI